MIFDTDVLIWYFRGNDKAKEFIHNTIEIAISAITLMELIQGIRNKQELHTLHKFLSTNDIQILYINEEITLHAIHLLEDYALSDGVELADALIAATSLHHGEEIITGNIKHYRCFPNLTLNKFTPDAS